MKKLFFVFLVLVLCVSISGAGTTDKLKSVIARKNVAAGGGGPYGDCDSAVETYMFVWSGDYTADTDKACFNSGAADKDGTDTGYISIDADKVVTTGGNNGVTWVVASNDGCNDALGTACITVKLTDEGNADVDGNGIFECNYGSGDDLGIITSDSADAFRGYEDGGNSVQHTSTISFGTYYRVCYTWDAGNDTHAISVVSVGDAVSWSDEDAETVDEFATDPDEIIIGEHYSAESSTDTLDGSDLYIMSTYKATDPCSEAGASCYNGP